MTTYIPAWIYQQFDADYSLEYPGEGYGGWRRIDAPFDLGRCAVAVMHAWQTYPYDVAPGHWRIVEYIPRSIEICEKLLPPFLEKVRAAGVRVIHINSDESAVAHYPGHKKIRELAGENPEKVAPIEIHGATRELRDVKRRIAYPGEHNLPDLKIRSGLSYDFDSHVLPAGDELVMTTGEEIVAACRAYGIDHIIYTGFAINFCLLMSPGGWLDLSRYDITCSAVKELVTAVENKESCREETHKQYGLWHIALCFGVGLEAADFINALKNKE